VTFRGINRTPVWSRDGSHIYFVTYDTLSARSAILVKAADGTGEANTIREISGQAYLEDLTPDGTTLIFSVSNPSVAGTTREKSTIFRLPVKGGEPEEIVHSLGNAANAALSPDGRWLAYNSDESGRFDVYVQAFGSSGSRSQVSTNGGSEPHFAPDGRAVYYQQSGQLVSVPIEPGPVFIPGRPAVLFSGAAPPASLDSRETYDVMPTGDRFVMMRPPEELGSLSEVRIVLNWFTELRPSGRAR
jgi:serine/threonine-protein kinase